MNWDLFLGPAPMRPFNELRFKYNWHWFWDTGNGDIGNQGVHEMGVARWGLGDPEWPKTAFAQGGKYAYDDDQETPNTLLASFDFGGRELVFEVRGLLTGGGRFPPSRRAGGAPAAGAVAPPDSPARQHRLRRMAPPMNVMVGNLFYGTEGWAAMSDQGFQAFKGESNELIMEERRSAASRAATGRAFTWRISWRRADRATTRNCTTRSANAYLSASLCHLANISYRVGRKLTMAAGPKFATMPKRTRC